MKLIGQLILLGTMMFAVSSTDAAWPGRTKGMAERQQDWKGKGIKIDENKATQGRRTREENEHIVKERRVVNKPGKMQTIKNRNPESYEKQINEETYNIKFNKQNKEQIKYGDKKNLGKESAEEKKTTSINYKSSGKEKKIKSKINTKEENKIKDDYKTVTENIERSKVSKSVNKRQNEEKNLGNIKIKKVKSKVAEEETEYSENDQKAQKYMNKDLKENSECETCNEGAKNDKYKVSKKQYKNKSGKKDSKKYKIKQDDDIENNQEEDKIKQKINPKKQYKVIYYDEILEVDDQGFQEDIEKTEEKCKQYKPMCIKQKSTYELKFEEDNENVADFLKEKRKPKTRSVQHVTQKYEGTLDDCVKHFNPNFQEECSDFITYKNKMTPANVDTLQEGNEKTGELRKPLADKEIYTIEDEEMIVKKDNIDTNGRINIDNKETKHKIREEHEIIEAPEGITAEQYEKVENLDMLKDSKLKLLRKYMLVEVTNNEETNLDESKSSNVFTNKNDETFESQETNESNSNLKTFMYIVEEAVNDHEIMYSVKEDDGEIQCSLPEEEEEESVEVEVNWL